MHKMLLWYATYATSLFAATKVVFNVLIFFSENEITDLSGTLYYDVGLSSFLQVSVKLHLETFWWNLNYQICKTLNLKLVLKYYSYIILLGVHFSGAKNRTWSCNLRRRTYF